MSTSRDTPLPQDLKALEDTYRIVGELSARDNVRGYLATRVEDGADVQILVEDQPEGDAGNALTHYAADANLLTTLSHRNLIPVHDARWLGGQSFALVTDRCAAPTMATLIAKGESWSYQRVATILHELNGLLEWARRQKVVHRTVTLDTLHLEPDTDRVLVTFVAQPLNRQGPPGPEGDARSIASLAWTLLTRGRDLPRTPEQSIGIVRPELPRRVVEATDALLHGQRVGETDPLPVLDYIALVATTDALRKGEADAAELQAVIHQEQVLEREAWAATEREYTDRLEEQARQIQAEREEMERTLIAEREELTATLADERRQMAEEREALEGQVAAERERMAAEHEELQRQLAAARADLEAQVASEREQLAGQRAELEREIADQRAQLEQQRAAHERELAGQRAAMEAAVAAEREQLAASLTDGERALAEARTEFEVEVRRQRSEFEALLASEREEFDRTIVAERNALEAEKEGLAVFHAGERAQIDAERRALEELLLAYEAGSAREGGTAGVRSADDESRSDERFAPRVPELLADLSALAVARPVTEPMADEVEPAETESGLTRKDAKRSRRAAWGIPGLVLMFVAILTAAALGFGSSVESDDGRRDAREAPTAPAAPRRAGAATPTLVDSAAGAFDPLDSAALRRGADAGTRRPASRTPAGGQGARGTGESTVDEDAAGSVVPARAFDTAMQTARPVTDSAAPAAPLPMSPVPAIQPRDTARRAIPNAFVPIPATADTIARRDTTSPRV